MNKLLIAATLTGLSLSAFAAEADAFAQVVNQEIAVKSGQKILIASDSGKLNIKTSESGVLSYRVEFVKNQTGWLDFGPKPTQKDFDECTAIYTEEKGLKIHTGNGLNAIVIVSVPAKNALDVQLASGVLVVGPRSGKVDAFIGSGTLEYDAAELPAGTCVTATINAGTVKNQRDFNCASVGAVLHGQSGLITVK